jgi:hypothetical protein
VAERTAIEKCIRCTSNVLLQNAARTADTEKLLADRVRLSKIQRLLHRRGVDVPYSTLHRFAVGELGFGQPTIPVADGKPPIADEPAAPVCKVRGEIDRTGPGRWRE